MSKDTKDKKNFKVYIYENMTNHKKYIGITCKSLRARSGHEGNGYQQCTAFWNAIQKYGWHNFCSQIVKDNLTREEACKLEIELIAQYKTQDHQYGYNITAGGDSGRTGMKYTEEERLMLSKNSINTKKVICTTTNVIYDSLTSAEKACGVSNANISRACKTGIAAGSNNGTPLYWAYLNEDGSYTQVLHRYPKRTKEVLCITTNKYFNSMTEAAEYYNIQPDSIYQCCVGRNKYGGKLSDGTRLVWQYA